MKWADITFLTKRPSQKHWTKRAGLLSIQIKYNEPIDVTTYDDFASSGERQYVDSFLREGVLETAESLRLPLRCCLDMKIQYPTGLSQRFRVKIVGCNRVHSISNTRRHYSFVIERDGRQK